VSFQGVFPSDSLIGSRVLELCSLDFRRFKHNFAVYAVNESAQARKYFRNVALRGANSLVCVHGFFFLDLNGECIALQRRV